MAEEQIIWTDDFLVGDDELDAQHKELVRLTNEFYNGTQMGGVVAKVFFMQTIKGALHYVKTHFSAEEKIMQKVGFPQYDEHKKQHEDFIAAVTRETQVFESQDNPDPKAFVKYLMDWITLHIADSDKKYAPYLAKNDQTR